MGRFVRWAALLPVVILLAACARTPVVEVGEPAPEVRLADTSGRVVSLEEMKGKVVLLNFWALWCEPCKAELPEFQEALETYGADGLAVVTVNLGDPVEDVRAYLAERGYSFITLVDPKLSLRRSYDTRILPLNIVLDQEGIVHYQRVTPFEPGDLAARVEALLGTTVARAAAGPGGGTPTEEPTPTASPTRTPSPVPSATASPVPSKPADTATPSPSPTQTATPTRTATKRFTATPSRTPVPSATATATPSFTPSPTHTPVPSATATATPSVTPEPTDTPVPSATATPSPSATPTDTAVPPTATETTEPPVYGVTLSGESYKTVYPNDWVELVGDLANIGNVEDTYLVGLNIQPRGWEAKYCIGPACYDYSVPSMPVTIPAGGHQQVSVKLKPPYDAPAGQTRSGNLWVASQSDPSVTAGMGVSAEVITP